MTRTYHVEPQRSTGRGWRPCEAHCAQRWAVIERRTLQSKGRRYIRNCLVERHLTRQLAELQRETLTRSEKPLPHPTLGQRFARTGRAIIAGSR